MTDGWRPDSGPPYPSAFDVFVPVTPRDFFLAVARVVGATLLMAVFCSGVGYD